MVQALMCSVPPTPQATLRIAFSALGSTVLNIPRLCEVAIRIDSRAVVNDSSFRGSTFTSLEDPGSASSNLFLPEGSKSP